MVSTLYCVETPEQARQILGDRATFGRDGTFLALTPSAEYAFEKAGIRAGRPEDYHSEEDVDQLGREQLRVVDEISQLIDDAVLTEVEAFRLRDLRPGSLYWYHLKLLLNSMAVRAYIMARVLDIERPETVTYFATDNGAPTALPPEHVTGSYWSFAIRLVARAKGTTLIELDGPRRRLDSQSGPARLKGLMRMLGAGRALRGLKATRLRLSEGRRRVNGDPGEEPNNRRSKLLALNLGHSLRQVIEAARRTGDFEVFHHNTRSGRTVRLLGAKRLAVPVAASELSDRLDRQLDNAWRRFEANEEVSGRLLRVAGVSYFEVVDERLRHLFSAVMPDMLRVYSETEAAIREIRPAVVIATTMLYPEKVAFEAARSCGVPRVVYSHGASQGNVGMETTGQFIAYQNDLRWSDLALTFGDGDTAYVEKFYPKSARAVSVGSAVLDELRKPVARPYRKVKELGRLGLDTNRPTVMYVPTSMDGHSRPIPSRSRSPSLMFEMQRALADVFSEFPDVQAVFKLHPADRESPIDDYIRTRKYSSCRVVTGSLRQLVHLADAFVFDYSSTALLEALTTDKPILFCGHELPIKFNPEKWHPSMLPMWQERIMYADDFKSFLDMLRAFLREGKFEPVNSSDEMLRLFGTHLDDGKSAERAVVALQEITNSQTTASGMMPA